MVITQLRILPSCQTSKVPGPLYAVTVGQERRNSALFLAALVLDPAAPADAAGIRSKLQYSSLSAPTWHDCLLAGNAFGGELAAVAVIAQQLLALAGEWLVGQRTVTAEATKAVLVVMAILVVQLLGRTAEMRRGPMAPGNCPAQLWGPILTLQSWPISSLHSSQVLAKWAS